MTMTSERYAHLRGTPLTTLDWELLQFMAEGMSFGEIGAIVNRSTDTVKHRAVRLYARLGVAGKRQAIARAYEMEGFVTATEDNNKQLRATIAGLRAKVSEYEKRATDAERELAELKKLLTTTDLPAAWLDSTQGQL